MYSELPVIRFHFRDRQHEMVDAWKAAFEGVDGVECSYGHIWDADLKPIDAIVSPANSFGYMDGGIDAVYTKRFGAQLQERLQKIIQEQHHGDLPVGQAQIMRTRETDDGIPYLISAPTMRVPGDISDSLNAYLAFRAVCRAVLLHNSQVEVYKKYSDKVVESDYITGVLCPGLGTAIGRLPVDRCASQMKTAYDMVIRKETAIPASLADCASKSHRMSGVV